MEKEMHSVVSEGGPGWENLNNIEGLPQVERAGRFGYHRAFIRKGDAMEKDWFFVKKGPDGWVRVTDAHYSGLGEVKEVHDGIKTRLAARVFKKDKDGHGVASAIYLPYIKGFTS